MRDVPSGDPFGRLRATLRILTTGRLARSFAVLMSGTAIAQLIALAASPVLTRLFEPEAFGLLGVFMSLVALLGTVAPLAFSLAIVVPEDPREADDLTILAGISTVAVTAFVALIVLVAHEPIAAALNAPGLAPLLVWLPLAVLADGCYRTLAYANLRARRERRVSSARIVHSVTTGALQIAFGVAGVMRQGLAVGYTLGHTVAAVVLFVYARQDRALPSLRETSVASLSATARRFVDFPLYKLPSQVVTVASAIVTIVALAALFPPAVVGLYALTRRVVRAPADLIGTTLADVFFASFGDRWRHDRAAAYRSWLRTTLLLGGAVVPTAFAFAAVAPSLFAWLFGEAWRDAGVFARWLGIYIAITTIARPSMMSLSVIGHQRVELLFATSRTILMVAALVAAAPRGPVASIVAHSLTGAALQVGLVAYTAIALRRAIAGRPDVSG